MQRASKFMIWKKDIGDTIQQKNIGEAVEYWIYKGRETNLVMPNGQKWVDETKKELVSIIVCKVDDHIVKETKEYIHVIGLKLNGPDIAKYVRFREEIK